MSQKNLDLRISKPLVISSWSFSHNLRFTAIFWTANVKTANNKISQVSISSTFYARVFSYKVLFSSYILEQKMYKKCARKMLMKLTPVLHNNVLSRWKLLIASFDCRIDHCLSVIEMWLQSEWPFDQCTSVVVLGRTVGTFFMNPGYGKVMQDQFNKKKC